MTLKDNLLNYSVGPIDMFVDTDKRVIRLSATSTYENMWKFFLSTIKDAWDISDKDIIKINEYEYEIPYSLETLENYLDNTIYFGDEIKS